MIRSALINIYGFPVHFLGLSPSALRKRLGRSGVCGKKTAPELTVEFVSSLRGFRHRGFHESSDSLLLGDRFALDYARRIVFVPLTAGIQTARHGRQPRHFLLERTVLFSLSLLYELDATQKRQKNVMLYIHASAVATRQGALIFCGESTFGKSTISERLLTPFAKIEDDQSMVRLNQSGRTRPEIVNFSQALRANRKHLPLRGKHAQSIPIRALFWLKKSPTFSIEPMNRAAIASKILMPMVNWSQPQAITRRLGLIRTLLANITCAELSFAKESKPLIALLKAHKFI